MCYFVSSKTIIKSFITCNPNPISRKLFNNKQYYVCTYKPNLGPKCICEGRKLIYVFQV